MSSPLALFFPGRYPRIISFSIKALSAFLIQTPRVDWESIITKALIHIQSYLRGTSSGAVAGSGKVSLGTVVRATVVAVVVDVRLVAVAVVGVVTVVRLLPVPLSVAFPVAASSGKGVVRGEVVGGIVGSVVESVPIWKSFA